jgi:fibronectin-binding autotransporter adhesin
MRPYSANAPFVTDRGFALPQLTTAQRDALAADRSVAGGAFLGLLIFNLDIQVVEVLTRSGWEAVASSESDISLIGTPGAVLNISDGGTLQAVAYSGSASDLTTGTLPNARLSAVPNSALANPSITIAGHHVSLGGSQNLAVADLTDGTTGSGEIVLQTSPTISSPTLTGTVSGSQVIPNSVLANSTLSLSVSGDTTLSSSQANNNGFEFTGTLTGNSMITWPSFVGIAVIQNGTTGGFSLTCGLATGDTVTIANGETAVVWSDGSNFLRTTAAGGGIEVPDFDIVSVANGQPMVYSVSLGAWTNGTASGNGGIFATTTGTLTNGHAVSIDSDGNLIDAGGPPTVGGGGGTVSAGIANQLTYYSANGNTVVGIGYVPLSLTTTNGDTASLLPGAAAYLSGSLTVKRAIGNSAATALVIGLSTGTFGAGNTSVQLAISDVLTLTTTQWDAVAGTTGGLTPGTVYFLHQTTPGHLTATPPTTTGQFVVQVGIALSATQLLIKLNTPIGL